MPLVLQQTLVWTRAPELRGKTEGIIVSKEQNCIPGKHSPSAHPARASTRGRIGVTVRGARPRLASESSHCVSPLPPLFPVGPLGTDATGAQGTRGDL